MRTYLVGGAVRDALLGLPVRERDWVVVGATPEDMTRAGYRLVGRDFPVFLHPATHEEYALARVERKTAPGYRGFSVAYAPQVTLEEDLQRRDLTINAIAQDESGALHDPYGGRADLELRRLRHVSPAFSEDPVRILRVARFAARFAPLGFTVDRSTLQLMQDMVLAGEASALVAERVWTETAKALREHAPSVYFETLADCGALAVVFPELDRLRADAAHWALALGTLDRAAGAGYEPRVRFAALLSGLPPEAVTTLCQRVRAPTDVRDLALVSAQSLTRLREAGGLDAAALLDVLESVDALRRTERFAELLQVAAATDCPAVAIARLRQAQATCAAVVLGAQDRAGLAGPAIGARMRALRITALEAMPPA